MALFGAAALFTNLAADCLGIIESGRSRAFGLAEEAAALGDRRIRRA